MEFLRSFRETQQAGDGFEGPREPIGGNCFGIRSF
jgi:hypothetical protein